MREKMPHLLAMACVLLLAVALHGLPARAETVATAQGSVGGATEGGVQVFKGIPYAAPPVGPLRWKPPAAPASWNGERKADTYGAACIQPPGLSAANGGETGPASEDCLFLNIWTSRTGRSAKLPVIVWIHGGGYVFGSGSLAVYNGAPLASRGAVVVTLNYRLGQLGFFAHPALEKEAPGGPVNFGLLDQIAALKWVRANIAAFGGDPGNVTIMGQSAGAKSVLALFASPLARGLFHKGVAASSYAVADMTRAKAVEIGAKVADALGLKGASASAADLRAVPASAFLTLKGQGLSTSPLPVAGDMVLPQPIERVFAAGREAALPLILGNTSDDASVAVAFGIDPAALLRKMKGAGLALRLVYPGVTDNAELARLVVRDAIFTLPVRWIADRHAKRATTWRYYFDYVATARRSGLPNGVPHGLEVPFLLDTGDLADGVRGTFTDADRAIARQVGNLVFAFARDGRPASETQWPSHRALHDRTLVIGETIAARSNFMRPRLAAFIGFAKVLQVVTARK